MRILTWNIQATKGCDGAYDAARTISLVKRYRDLDVICLQEVSKNIPELNSDDQPQIFASEFPSYETIWAPGFCVPDANGGRSEFGNLTLVRRGLLKWSRVHSLPSPPVAELQMPRTAVEAVVGYGDVDVTIFNTHLAFHSTVERVAQFHALTNLRDGVMTNAMSVIAANAWGPYSYNNRSSGVILCGDLNVGSETAEFKQHLTDQNWVDCWTMQSFNNNANLLDRQPTVGCFDSVQWPQGPFVSDYFLATENIAAKTKTVEVDVETSASDHQPVVLELAS